MDPSRKRRLRLVIALTAAVLLAGALVYTSFSASSEARTPSQLFVGEAWAGLPARAGRRGSGHRGATTLFRVRDRSGSASVPVSYTGSVPDPFRDGREVIVTVHERRGSFVGERDTLITKCPSKYSDKPQAQVVHPAAAPEGPEPRWPRSAAPPILALGVCVYGVAAAHRRSGGCAAAILASSARRAIYAAAALLTIAMGVLEAAFLRNDFSFDTVASHSSTTTPLFYKAAAHVVVAGGFAAALGLAARRCGRALVLFLTASGCET